MRFRYPLQKIVDLKSSEKSMAEWAYAAALGRLRQEEETLGALLSERETVEAQMAQTASARVTLAELAAIQHYLDVLDRRIQRQRERVETAEAQVRVKRNGLVEKSVDEKVWLNTREKAFEAFKQDWLKKQQNELDEIAMVRFAAGRT